jgi:hypothetical protein
MSDLFISYSSKDRPWAERLYADLTRKFPTMRIFWDRESIPQGVDYRPILDRNAREATHFAVLWSENAKASNEVGPEIQMFQQNVLQQPTREGVSRTLFYIPLEGAYGPLEGTQGVEEFRRRATYDAAVQDKGTSKLAAGSDRTEWIRLVRVIGDTFMRAHATQPVNLGLLVMNQKIADLLDPFFTIKAGPEPTLQELLGPLGLSLQDAKDRYGADAFAWRPFGTAETVIDLLEEVRVDANSHLNEHSFHWVPFDLLDLAMTSANGDAARKKFQDFAQMPSLVVIDPISLYHPYVLRVLPYLEEYSKREPSVIISLSPNETPSAGLVYQSLRDLGKSILEGYFFPQIPPTGGFARCGLNLQHTTEVYRLVRSTLGLYHLQRRKAEEKPLVSPVS